RSRCASTRRAASASTPTTRRSARASTGAPAPPGRRAAARTRSARSRADRVETLAYGYGLVEGPRPAPDGSVYFSDVLGGGVHRWTPDGRVELVVPKRRGIGG